MGDGRSGRSDSWRNLIELGESRAAEHPDRPLYTFLQLGGGEETLTNGTFSRRTRALAATLQSRLQRGERVLLLLAPGLDYIVAYWSCLYAGVIAVPAYPPDPTQLHRTLPRLGAIIRDSAATTVLTMAAIRDFASPLLQAHLGLNDLRWIAVEEAGDANDWRDPGPAADDLALLQYTSGSTRDPFGVMLTHRNVISNLHMARIGFGLDDRDLGLVWLPPYHDMGLFGGIVEPLVADFPITLLSPLDFLRNPIWWLELISERKISASGGPNFGYDLCVRKATPAIRERLDLSSWQVAFSGAEPIRTETLRRFADAFAPCGFRWEAFMPAYGLAEATVMVAAAPRPEAPVVRVVDEKALAQRRIEPPSAGRAVELVSSGKPSPMITVRVVDPDTQALCGPDRVGEIWLAGENIASGYWNKPDDNQRVFGARLPGDDRRYLRTGDLGFLADDNLFIVGRLKDIIIVAGANYYPQDIEAVVSDAHPFVRPGCAAAFSIERGGTEALAIVVETKDGGPAEQSEAAGAIQREVAAQVGLTPALLVLIPKGLLPKTSSGKIRRRATREALDAGTLSPFLTVENAAGVVPGTDGERKDSATPTRASLASMNASERRAALTRIVLDTIGGAHTSALGEADLDTPIGKLGIDSVTTVELLTQLEDELQVVLPMEDLVRGSSLRTLIETIDANLDGPAPKEA